jgi:hypothetical protein
VAFPKDRLPLKITVYTTFLLETAQTGLITHDAFKFFAFGFTDPSLLDEVSTGWFSIPVMTGISELYLALILASMYGRLVGLDVDYLSYTSSCLRRPRILWLPNWDYHPVKISSWHNRICE